MIIKTMTFDKSSIPLYYAVNRIYPERNIIAINPCEIKDFITLTKEFTIFHCLTRALYFKKAQQGLKWHLDTDDEKLNFYFAKVDKRFNLEVLGDQDDSSPDHSDSCKSAKLSNADKPSCEHPPDGPSKEPPFQLPNYNQKPVERNRV